jgi:HD superfamily phosphohydrolase
MAVKGIEEYGKKLEPEVDDYESKAKRLLVRKKRIRDPIHKDIEVNDIEIKIIDTKDFQRLRHISQLGASYLVYPGLRHTRFEHSLGTLHMAQKMIDAINSNPLYEKKVQASYEILLIRLHALLHDLAHVPFGHTIEDEGNLYPSQWKDERRVERFLGENSEIGKILIKYVGDKCRNDLIKILKAKDVAIKDLQYPFAVDIVANTICADLLDYLKRDIYFAGLEEAYDERFLKYLIVRGDNDADHKNRLALRLFGNKGNIRRDNVSEILHLLRLRYSMGEKIYFHHAKIAASAMIISAVRAVQPSISDSELFDLGDDEFLLKLQEKNNNVTNYILERFKSRRIYKSIYKYIYRPPGLGYQDEVKKDKAIEEYRIAEKREKIERLLEKWSDLPNGSVIIYCPDPDMALKPAKARVLWTDNTIYELKDVPDPHIKGEVDSINENHRRLWQLSVFIAPDFYESDKAKYVASDFAKEIGLKNDIEEYPDDQESWEIRQLKGFIPRISQETGKNVTVIELGAMERALRQEIAMAGPPLKDEKNLYYDRVKSFIETYRKGE